MIVIKAGFFSIMIESSLRPNRGTGSLSDRITPYLGNSCLRISVFKPFEKLLLHTTSYMDSSLRYYVVMSAKIFKERNQKFVELLFKMFNSFGKRCCKIGSCPFIRADLIELRHSTIYRIVYRKSSAPSN